MKTLSYTWVEPDKLGLAISSNVGKFAVRENLWVALSHSRHPSKARALWIDAICINKKNVLERNSQLKQMGRGCPQARRVAVWLGRSDKESEVAMNPETPGPVKRTGHTS